MRKPLILIAALLVGGCSKDEPKPTAASASASATAPATTTASSGGAASATPSATASAAPGPKVECPKGSSGEGTFDKPCEAKGNARMMEAVWTNKTDDKGPFFKVTNKSDKTILYGRIDVFFYDKAGKPLEVKDSEGKAKPYQECGGNIFSGVMKPAEKATIQFSCVKKDHVPEGTAAIEGELVMVGFADATEKKSESYWKNPDLSPAGRKKGGVK
jgi:hypothetical protein